MKFNYRYSLEKHRNGKPKHICPQCGKRRFVRYIDNHTNKYVADHVGKCDRQGKCKYHLHPNDYLKGTSAAYNYNAIPEQHNARKENGSTSQIQIVDSIPFDYADRIRLRTENNLNGYLYRILGEDRVNKANWNYYVGSAMNAMTIFPLIDANGILRSAKFMLYNPDTGKRLRDVPYAFDWLHSVLMKRKLLSDSFVLKTCLFGEHLIGQEENVGKVVCIVESEKTALIASVCISECLFMATGSLENLTLDRLKPLRGRRIKLYPDTSQNGSAFEKWSKKADEARLLGFDISVSDFLERYCTDEQRAKGWDLGDYLLHKILQSKHAESRKVEQPTEPPILSAVLSDMIRANPVLATLIDAFGLVEV